MHVYINILSGLDRPTAFELNLLQCLLQYLNLLQIYYGGSRNLTTLKMKFFATITNG